MVTIRAIRVVVGQRVGEYSYFRLVFRSLQRREVVGWVRSCRVLLVPRARSFRLLIVRVYRGPVLVVRLSADEGVLVGVLRVDFFRPNFEFETSRFRAGASGVARESGPLVVLVTPVPILARRVRPCVPPRSIF